MSASGPNESATGGGSGEDVPARLMLPRRSGTITLSPKSPRFLGFRVHLNDTGLDLVAVGQVHRAIATVRLADQNVAIEVARDEVVRLHARVRDPVRRDDHS